MPDGTMALPEQMVTRDYSFPSQMEFQNAQVMLFGKNII